MTKRTLFILWGGLFAFCAVLGLAGVWLGTLSLLVQSFFTAAAMAFFVPPAVLVYRAFRENDRDVLALVRNLSLASLILTAVTLVANLLSAMESELVGDLLYGILVVVSTPMVCSGYWALSLFLWACLLMTTLKLLQKK